MEIPASLAQMEEILQLLEERDEREKLGLLAESPCEDGYPFDIREFIKTYKHQARTEPDIATPLLPSASPRPATPISPLSDLVSDNHHDTNYNNAYHTAPILDRTSLLTSKHQPDFRVRNQLKILTLSTTLSDLQLALSAAQRAKDQAALDALYARVTETGEGLVSVAVLALVSGKDAAARRPDGWQLSEVYRSMKKGQGEWYQVKHGGVREEGGEHEKLCSERVRLARYVYEAGLDGREALAEETIYEADADGGVELVSDRELQDESQEATLVEGVEGLALLHPTVSQALLDGTGP